MPNQSTAIAVVIGALGALLGVYFREAVRAAYKQKAVASKFDAQLSALRGELLEKPDTRNLLMIGLAWHSERLEAIRTDGVTGYQEVEEKYKVRLAELRKELEAGNEEVDASLKKLYAAYREMPEKAFAYTEKQWDAFSQSLVTGTSLITDDEAASLVWHSTDCCTSKPSPENRALDPQHCYHNACERKLRRR
ncbi:MAG: hypothetical protein RKP20_03530 [Candidatus Competibacter sp.]|nr:hypothetical protein [Candidatus Competibacter sp.]